MTLAQEELDQWKRIKILDKDPKVYFKNLVRNKSQIFDE